MIITLFFTVLLILVGMTWQGKNITIVFFLNLIAATTFFLLSISDGTGIVL